MRAAVSFLGATSSFLCARGSILPVASRPKPKLQIGARGRNQLNADLLAVEAFLEEAQHLRAWVEDWSMAWSMSR